MAQVKRLWLSTGIVGVCLTLALSSSIIWAQNQKAALARAATVPPAAVVGVDGLDLHDGTVMKAGSTYYMYGTMYGCGFHWGQAGTPWCGFGVSTSPSLSGPWTKPVQLFSPASMNSYDKLTWQQTCSSGGAGCFNPRMVQRTWGPADKVNILWFNAPGDYARTGANAYYVMGCNGPAGPCGETAGPPYGSLRKPPMYKCYGNGDFSIVTRGTDPAYIVCTMADQTLSIEQLDYSGTSGNGVGASNLAGLKNVESPGAYFDTASGKWIMTYSDPNCGYCAGDGTSYATATSLTGPWTAPANTGYSADPRARRAISASSCGGQPRTAFVVDNQPYQYIDLWGIWNGDASNQAGASSLFASLTYMPQPGANGKMLPPQFAQWPCP